MSKKKHPAMVSDGYLFGEERAMILEMTDVKLTVFAVVHFKNKTDIDRIHGIYGKLSTAINAKARLMKRHPKDYVAVLEFTIKDEPIPMLVKKEDK